ncbi:MAG: phosphatase PAP2 family protein [Spirochaetales bacterium]|nr:phosphatase PAP2 family protein [Spirochaetales bacterium]MBQ7728763.1 phosphatase PAP2 family protein [Spirochaetales bacterium]
MRLETKQRTCTVLGLAFLVIFLLFTYMVMKYDTAPVGFGGSVIGFSRFNTAFHELFPGDKGCYAASETLGYICLMLAGANAIIAIADFIRHRGIMNMHRRNIITMCYYAVVVAFYVLFEFVVINQRPTEAEASYPSSHTMLALCVLYSEFVLLGFAAERNRSWASVFRIVCIVAMLSMIAFRLLSGVHWFTDICGGILLSLSLMMFYRACICRFCER